MAEHGARVADADKMQALSETFFSDVFSYFGIKASSLILLSGVVISGFGLTDIINPAIWLVASISAMIISYSLRHYISARYMVVLLLSVAIFLAVTAFVAIIGVRPLFPATVVASPLFDPVCAFAAFLFASLLFSLNFVSYKKLIEASPTDLPASMVTALKGGVYSNPFYYELMEYEVELFPIDTDANSVRKVFSVTLIVRNRTSETRAFLSRYHTPPGTFELLSAKTDGQPRDLDDRRIYSKDGLLLSDSIPGRGSIKIEVKMLERAPAADDDLFTAYSCFAEQFRFTATNHAESGITMWIEPLHGQESLPVRRGRTLTWTSDVAILPNQGVRLHWMPKE